MDRWSDVFLSMVFGASGATAAALVTRSPVGAELFTVFAVMAFGGLVFLRRAWK